MDSELCNMFSNMDVDSEINTNELCDMFSNMAMKKKTEYKINDEMDFDNVKALLQGKQLTKRVRKSSANKKDITKWYFLTKNRYKIYKYFEYDPNEDHKSVVQTVKQINKIFEQDIKDINMNKLINLVYRVDSELKKKLMNWECIKKN